MPRPDQYKRPLVLPDGTIVGYMNQWGQPKVTKSAALLALARERGLNVVDIESRFSWRS